MSLPQLLIYENVMFEILTCFCFIICTARYNSYCEVVVDGQKHGNLRTEVIKKSTTPTWDDEFTAYVLI